MATGEFKPITCNANGYCVFRCFSTTGWGCTYTEYCDYQLPLDSRTFKFPNDNNEEKKK